MSIDAETYRFSVEEYNRLDETGFFSEDDRVELLDGEIIVMSPIGRRHVGVVRKISRLLHQRAFDHGVIDTQNPFILGAYSEPQPDLILLKPSMEGTMEIAQPEDILLVIEVSESSLRYDRGKKLKAYAHGGIIEVWIVNLVDEVVECFRQPKEGRYSEMRSFRRGEEVTVEAVPTLVFAAADLLP